MKFRYISKSTNPFKFLARKETIFALVSIFCIGFVYHYQSNVEELNSYDLMVEFTGFIYDIIFFGFIISVYDYFSRKREKISNLELELNQIRFLATEESKYRQLAITEELLQLKKRPTFELLKLPKAHISLPNKDIVFYGCDFATDEPTKYNFGIKNFNSKRNLLAFHYCKLRGVSFYNLIGMVFILESIFYGRINKCNVANLVMHNVSILNRNSFKNEIDKNENKEVFWKNHYFKDGNVPTIMNKLLEEMDIDKLVESGESNLEDLKKIKGLFNN